MAETKPFLTFQGFKSLRNDDDGICATMEPVRILNAKRSSYADASLWDCVPLACVFARQCSSILNLRNYGIFEQLWRKPSRF